MKRFLEQLAGAIVTLVGFLFLLFAALVLFSADFDQMPIPLGLFGVPAVVLLVVGVRLLRGRPAATNQSPSAESSPVESPFVESSPLSEADSEPLGAEDVWLTTEDTKEPAAKKTSTRDGYTCPGCGSRLSRKASVSPKGDTRCEYCDRWFNIHEDSPPARSSKARQSAAGNRGSLVHCRDCGHQISRKATVCPNCGAPLQVIPNPAEVLREQQRQHRELIAQQEREAAEEKRRKLRDGNIGCGCLVVFVGFALLVLWASDFDDPPDVARHPIETPGGSKEPDPFQEPAFETPGLIQPGPVLATLSSAGFSPGIWRQSNSVDGGWCCSSLGDAIEFGPPGQGLIPMSSNLSLFVYGSGPLKLDRLVIKLNVNNGHTANEGKQRLSKVIAALLESLETETPDALKSAITNAPIRFFDEPGDIDNTPLWQSEIPNATASLELEQTRLTALVFTILANDASTLWD